MTHRIPSFHLPLTFITLSMLVVGGMQSLSGAVIGTVAVTAFLQLLRWFETNGWIPSSSADVGLGIVLLLVLIKQLKLFYHYQIIFERFSFWGFWRNWRISIEFH